MIDTQPRFTGKTARFEDVCERIDYGFTVSADFSIKEPRLLRITDIQDGRVEWAAVPGCQITPNEEKEHRLLDGDVVFARTGATTGKSFLIRHVPRAVFASYLIRLRVGKEVLPEYFAAFCQSDLYWRQVNREMRGSAQAGVNSTLLGSLVMPVPELTEQKRVAAILDQVDRLRTLHREALHQAEHLFQTLLHRAFTSGL